MSPLSLFRQRDFCIFWIGSFASGIGSQFTTVAMAWQIYELTNSAFQLGLLGLVRAVPQAIILLVGGLLADAINRRKLMMCTQIGLFGVSTMLAWLTLSGRASAGMLYVATMLLAVFSSLETPSRHSIIPNLAPREYLGQAVALQSAQRYVSVIAGPSLAGIILAFFGPTTCYVVDALSWLVMLVSLVLLRTKLQEGLGWKSVSLRSLREGFKFVLSHGVIFPLMLLDCAATFFGNARALFPIYARDILLVGPKGLGLLYASRAFGSFASATTLSFLGPVRQVGRWIVIGVAVYGIATALFADSHIFWFSMLMLALSGAGDTTSAILRNTINQSTTPDELRGRMSSISSFFTSSGPQLGQFESGVVAAWLGTELSALTGGLAVLIILAVVVAVFPVVAKFQIREDLHLNNNSS
jgi:MFS family permease